MELVIEKLERKDFKEAIGVYDDNHNLKSNYEKLGYNREVGYIKIVK